MKKANIIRSIFWGTIALILLTLGISGLIYYNQIFNERKTELTRIISTFNNSEIIENYKSVNTKITAELDGKNIYINYTGVENKEYIYKLKSKYLETTLNKNDSIGKIILMVITDSVAVSKGQIEGSTHAIFNDNTVLKYKFIEGIEFKQEEEYYKVKINLDNYINIQNNNFIN